MSLNADVTFVQDTMRRHAQRAQELTEWRYFMYVLGDVSDEELREKWRSYQRSSFDTKKELLRKYAEDRAAKAVANPDPDAWVSRYIQRVYGEREQQERDALQVGAEALEISRRLVSNWKPEAEIRIDRFRFGNESAESRELSRFQRNRFRKKN